MTFAIGENVGPYRVHRPACSGGWRRSTRYHAALDRHVAIKVMHAAFKQDPNFLARFQREARIVARLEHPHIVPVYDLREHEGQPYLVMRFIEGDTLKARLQTGPMTIAQVIDISRPVCQALAYAHDQGVLHRDIKPSNILLSAQGGVFLTDFGLAKIAQAVESTLSQDAMIGTPQYISPEQAQGNASLDARTDIYSLGVVLYELFVAGCRSKPIRLTLSFTTTSIRRCRCRAACSPTCLSHLSACCSNRWRKSATTVTRLRMRCWLHWTRP